MSRRRRIREQLNDGVVMVSSFSENEKPMNKISKRWRKILIWLPFCVPLVAYAIFTILRRGLRSRPAWIYGKPMIDDLSSCLITKESPAQISHQPPQVLWEWHNHSTTTTNYHHHPNVLIAQYSGFGEYAKFLNLVSPIHQRYAQQKGYDYVILHGTLLDFPGIKRDCNPNPRATFDKIPILEMALSSKMYDFVLILDTDSMIVNMDIDLTSLVPDHKLMAAQRVWKYDWKNTWDVNAGVTIWNLRHPLAESVTKRWKSLSLYGDEDENHLETILAKNDDQYFLQTALLEIPWWKRPVASVENEFNYYQGTVIKHFKRDERSWSTNGLVQRLERVREAIQELCSRHSDYCHLRTQTDYSQLQPPSAGAL